MVGHIHSCFFFPSLSQHHPLPLKGWNIHSPFSLDLFCAGLVPAQPPPRLWHSGRAPEVPTQWRSTCKVKPALKQLRDQCRAALTGRRLLAFFVFLHKLSSLIAIPRSLQARFSFYHTVEGTNETAAVWWSPTSGILGSPQKKKKKKNKNKWFWVFFLLFLFGCFL